MLTITDEALVGQITLGSREAYQQLLSRQLPALTHYVVRMLGNSADAEDILQEVFLRLWTHADRYKAEVARVSTWLHRIAYHLCIDYIRKHQRLELAAAPPEVTGGEEPDQLLSEEHANMQVKQALLALPERQRSAVILCHYQELSNKEAASILDVSVDALESLLARGRRNLKIRLEISP
ncbi:MAG: RNA polymerase sigma factor (sigma-70 family) [Candidatus Pseudothioglobus sp.]